MKKLIIALVALFVAFNAQAQIGVVAGVTSSATNVKAAYADVDNITQYHVGAVYKIGIGNILAIQPGLVYNVKGTKFGDIGGLGGLLGDDNDIDVNYKTGFLEVPVQIQAGMGIGSIVRVYGFAEPFIGYAITNDITAEGLVDFALEDESKWQNVKNKLEYGVSLGAGVEVLKHLQVSVKYFWNLGDLYGKEVTVGSIKEDIGVQKCSGVAASVAFLF